MKQTINLLAFGAAFYNHGRENQFSWEARKALFRWLENYEADTGEELELDVIALCCDFTEYSTPLEAYAAYNSDIPESSDEAIAWLEDNTTVIQFDGGVIIQDF